MASRATGQVERPAVRARYDNEMTLRTALALVLAALLSTEGFGIAAASTPGGGPVVADNDYRGYQADESAKTAHLSGDIVEVDFSRGALVVQTGHGKTSITVLPSTNIFLKGNSFGTLSDLRRGSQVEIFASRSGSHLIAQIIRIR